MRGRVLVVDDEVALAELIRFWLDSQGFDVVLAHEGEAAIRAYEEGRFAGEPVRCRAARPDRAERAGRAGHPAAAQGTPPGR